MKILFAGGGTAGHINPAIAVAEHIVAQERNADIRFFGTPDRLEKDLVPRAGFKLYSAPMKGLSRSFGLKGIKNNADAVVKLVGACSESRRIIREFAPDIVIGTGGYVAFPAVYMAQRMSVPTILMEFNASPGVVTKKLAARASKILVAFKETKQILGGGNKIAITGSPVRASVTMLDRKAAKEKLGLCGKPLVVSFWGSLGARQMNDMMLEFIKREAKDTRFYHIHASGKSDYGRMKREIDELGIDDGYGIRLHDYIYDMPTVISAADLVVCRAGSSTLAELCAAGRASVLVPSPNVTENHQEKNAAALAAMGAAVCLHEADCTADTLYDIVRELSEDASKRRQMEKCALNAGGSDAVVKVFTEISSLIKR